MDESHHQPSSPADSPDRPVGHSTGHSVAASTGASTGDGSLRLLQRRIVECEVCPRLVEWRRQIAETDRRASFRDQDYWGRPVPGFGDPRAQIVIVGLAPAAHGGNRTGRIFTGDRSGDWLFAALYRAGLANQPTSVSLDDGLVVDNTWITAAVKCAPPANKPTIDERDACTSRYLINEFAALSQRRVAVCLGKFAYDVTAAFLGLRPRPKFGHGVEAVAPDGSTVLCSFHPSQQNTFTGKLTEPMLDDVFTRAIALAASDA